MDDGSLQVGGAAMVVDVDANLPGLGVKGSLLREGGVFLELDSQGFGKILRFHNGTGTVNWGAEVFGGAAVVAHLANTCTSPNLSVPIHVEVVNHSVENIHGGIKGCHNLAFATILLGNVSKAICGPFLSKGNFLAYGKGNKDF